MSRRSDRKCNTRSEDLTGSPRAKRHNQIEATARLPIKHKRKRNAGTEPDYGLSSESSEPLKKSPKETEKMDCSDDTNCERVSPETEKMDCSDDTNREMVSPDGNRSKDNKDLTALPQDPADVDEAPSSSKTQTHTIPSEMKPICKPTVLTTTAVNTGRVICRTSMPRFSGPAQADSRQPSSYREPHYCTDMNQSAHFIRPSASDYGIKQPTDKGSKSFFWKLAIPTAGLIAVLSACVFCLWTPEATALRALKERMELLLGKWNEIQTMYPSQQQELWFRSMVLLKKHAGATTAHSQPVILMFTAARDAEKTMRCLTSRIAGAYASAFSSTVVEIDGSSKKSLKSDDVKLDLDEQLSSAFSQGRKSAVIHHFQDLPPPSTLLFYKYCDHENAAFKDVSLVITVLLDEPTLEPDLPLAVVEETVYDFLKEKFCSDEPGLFNDMDMDKLSGLWSRISHVVLPVRPEKEIEGQDCPV